MDQHSEDLAVLAAEMGRETPRAAPPPAADVSDIRMSLRTLSDAVAALSNQVSAMPAEMRRAAKADAVEIAKKYQRATMESVVDVLTDAIDRGDGDVRADLKRVRADLGSELTSLKSTAAMSTENAKAVVSGYISHICQGE